MMRNTAEEVHVSRERVDGYLVTWSGEGGTRRSISDPSIMLWCKDIKIIIENWSLVLEFLPYHYLPYSPKRAVPPKRNNSFLRILAVRVALLLTPGGSLQASSVTFNRASCYHSTSVISRNGEPLVCTVLEHYRCQDRRSLRHDHDLSFCCFLLPFWIAWRLSTINSKDWDAGPFEQLFLCERRFSSCLSLACCVAYGGCRSFGASPWMARDWSAPSDNLIC